MGDARWWLVCYDVHDPVRLRRCAGVLEGHGQRMQHSVFRCWLTPAGMQRLRRELTAVLAPEDELLMIPLCRRCVGGMQTIHSSAKAPDWPDGPQPVRFL